MIQQVLVWVPKDSGSVVDYRVNWKNWLVGQDQIALSTLVPKDGRDAGVTIKSEQVGATSHTVVLQGGTSGMTARFINSIKTAAGLEEQVEITLKIN